MIDADILMATTVISVGADFSAVESMFLFESDSIWNQSQAYRINEWRPTTYNTYANFQDAHFVNKCRVCELFFTPSL